MNDIFLHSLNDVILGDKDDVNKLYDYQCIIHAGDASPRCLHYTYVANEEFYSKVFQSEVLSKIEDPSLK